MSVNMGNHENKSTDGGDKIYCLKPREVRIMSEIWKFVETDLVHYGTQFYSLLLHNHPEYVKYFQEKKPHEFQVDVPAMRTIFSLTCSTLAALFVEYSHKPQPRENLLGYVAMVHKDMNLTQKDMENFMMDMLEMLMQHFPELMTAECCLAYIRYALSLTSRLHILMKKQRELATLNKGFREMPEKNQIFQCFRSSNCTWLPCHHQNLIHGRPAEYWAQKKRHWILQRAVWATAQGGEKNRDSSVEDIISKSSVTNVSAMSVIEDSTSTEEDRGERAIRNKSVLRKRQFRKLKEPSTLSNDDVTDVDAGIILKSSDLLNGDRRPIRSRVRKSLAADHSTNSANRDEYRPNEVNRGRYQLVSMATSTARERRRKNSQEAASSKVGAYPRTATRTLTIVAIGTGRNADDSSSPDEAEERDFGSRLLKSRNVANCETRERGTSISNVPNHFNVTGGYTSTGATKRSYVDERPRTTFSVKNDPPASTIGSGTATSRNIKTNKRVSISNAHWITPEESDR